MVLRTTVVSILALSMVAVVVSGFPFDDQMAAWVNGKRSTMEQDCNKTTCQGPVMAFWPNKECKGEAKLWRQLLDDPINDFVCAHDYWETSSRYVKSELFWDSFHYPTPNCTGPPSSSRRVLFRKCFRSASWSVAFIEDVNDTNIIPNENPNANLPGPVQNDSTVRCQPGSCTNTFLEVEWGDGSTCLGDHLSEAGSQWLWEHGVCYRAVYGGEFSHSWRISCYGSDIREESFELDCDGFPTYAITHHADQERSNTSMTISMCSRPGSSIFACRNPVAAPPPQVPPQPQPQAPPQTGPQPQAPPQAGPQPQAPPQIGPQEPISQAPHTTLPSFLLGLALLTIFWL